MHHSNCWNIDHSISQEVMALKLNHAVLARELKLVYQPVVDIRSNRVAGFEALLRWTDQTGAEISPAVFIPLAEKTGLIGQIGRWVMIEACTRAARWSNAQTVAVNVSAAQLDDPTLVETIKEALQASRLPAERLEIELTETAALADKALAACILTDIRNIGVGIALDDFGTCYSSLTILQNLPLTRLKIDRSFVQPINSSRRSLGIARAIMVLAKAYDLDVTAEGIETLEQMKALASIGCLHMQGYLFGKPRPIEHWQDATGCVMASGHAAPLVHAV